MGRINLVKIDHFFQNHRGVALVMVLGVTLFASITLTTIFSLLQQGTSMSRSFGQRITASAWNDRILTRIAAVIAAHPWDKRFYLTRKAAADPLYLFNVDTFPFEDLKDDCQDGNISFEGAIMDVPGERKYWVKLIIKCYYPSVTYATFTEARYSPGLLDLANRGVEQISMSLTSADLGLSTKDFATSIKRIGGIAEGVASTTAMPAARAGFAQEITPEMVAVPFEAPTENNVTDVSKEFVDIAGFIDYPDREYFVGFLEAFKELALIDENSPKDLSLIQLPGGTLGEWYKKFGAGDFNSSPANSTWEKKLFHARWTLLLFGDRFPVSDFGDCDGMIFQHSFMVNLAVYIYSSTAGIVASKFHRASFRNPNLRLKYGTDVEFSLGNTEYFRLIAIVQALNEEFKK